MAGKQSKESSKPSSARLNIIYIIYILRQYTDEQHPMSITEITDRLNKEFAHISERDIFMSNDTVGRTLDAYMDERSIQNEYSMSSPFVPIRSSYISLGFRIVCVKEQGRRLYYYRNDLEDAEIRILMDSVKTCSYLAEEDVINITQKLIALQPRTFQSYKYYEKDDKVRDENSLLMMNVDSFNEILRNKKCARITYCNYDLNKELVPRKGYPKVIRPVSMMWSNGYYYLVAYSKKYQNTINYRMDRITDVEEVDEINDAIQDGMDPAWYRLKHPIMFGGKTEKIKMLCRDTGKNYIMNVIMDYFGRLAKVRPAADKELLKYTGRTASEHREEGSAWIEVTMEASVEGAEMLAFQYCEDCLIISPESSRKRLLQKMQNGANLYRDQDF